MSFQWSSDSLFDAADLGLGATTFKHLPPNQEFYVDPNHLSNMFVKLEETRPSVWRLCDQCDAPSNAIFNAFAKAYCGFVHFCPHEIVFVMEEN